MKILLTGANGFTGAHFSTMAQEVGFDVHALKADLLDSMAVQKEVLDSKPDLVVHLAAISFVAHDDVETMYGVNVIGTRNLLSAISDLDELPKAVLLASSANIYGQAENEVLDENTPIKPSNDYGVSKVAMEYVARLWMERLPIIITRPFNYTGEGQDPKFVIPKIVEHFKDKKTEIELGNIDVYREFSDVRVVCSDYLKLLTIPVAVGGTFNVCSGAAYSLRDIIAKMELLAGCSINVKVTPEFVRANEIKRLVGNNTLLRSIIGQQPSYNIEETLSWMYNS